MMPLPLRCELPAFERPIGVIGPANGPETIIALHDWIFG
jgi:hypothetical protein